MYNNEEDPANDLSDEIEVPQPKQYMNQDDIHLRRLMKREKNAINRVKNRMAILKSSERQDEMHPPLQNMAFKQSTEKYMQEEEQP